jgi:hypothetical protein
MTRRDTLQCVHEPFGDAYYFGPERLAERYEDNEKARVDSGYSDSTYKSIFDRIAKENSQVGLLSLLSLIACHYVSFFFCRMSLHATNQLLSFLSYYSRKLLSRVNPYTLPTA